jgi:hypothetical protein
MRTRSAVPRERRSEQPSVIRQDVRIPVAEGVQEPGRALDVGKEKGDATRRKIGHAR